MSFKCMIVVSSFLMLNCTDTVIMHFIVKNETQHNLNNLEIKVTGGAAISDSILYSGKSKHILLNMSNIPKHDGGYSIKYNLQDSIIMHNFGYYTNGYPINNLYQINIQIDTIIIKED